MIEFSPPTKQQPPRRYIVQDARHDREMDVLELCDLLYKGEIAPSTPVQPAAGGEWRSIADEPELAAMLPKLTVLAIQPWWNGLLFLGVIWLPYACFAFMRVDFVLAWWPLLLLKLSISSVTSLAGLVDFLANAFSTRRRTVVITGGMLIPLWSSMVGYRRFKVCAATLPPPWRCFVRAINPPLWLTLAALYLCCYGIPPDDRGGLVIWSIYTIFVLLLTAATLPLLPEIKRRRDARMAQHPTPDKKLRKKSWWWSAWQWHWVKKWVIPQMLGMIGCLLLGVAIFLAPWYVIGKVRLAAQSHQEPWCHYPLTVADFEQPLPGPHAAPELEKIEIPEFPPEESFVAWLDPIDPLPEASRHAQPELERKCSEAAPALAAIRAVLRRSPRLGLKRQWVYDGEQPIDAARKKLSHYLAWRRAEFRLALERQEEVGSTDFFADLATIGNYLREDIRYGIFYLRRLLGWRLRTLAARLPELTAEELAAEEAYWRRAEYEFSSSSYRRLFADNAYAFEYLSRNVDSILYPFRDGLKATTLEYTMRYADLLQSDAFRNREAYAAFQRELSRLGAFHWGWANFMVDERQTYNHITSVGRALCRLATTGIKLEQRRRADGRYPKNPELPTDPFDGKPLKYRPDEALLYSVGPDRIDDGGRDQRRHEDDTVDIPFPLRPPPPASDGR
jgi:hypothetical protein